MTARAVRLLLGEGVAPAPREAARLLEEAAQAGSGRAAVFMAVLVGAGVAGRQSWADALDYLETAAKLGDWSAQRQLALLAEDSVLAGQMDTAARLDRDIWRSVRKRIDISKWITAQPAGLLARSPQIVAFPRFIPPAVCSWLIGRGEEDPQVALVYDPETGASRPDPLRTNAARRLGIVDLDVVVLLLQARIGVSAGFSPSRMEGPNILRYEVGQQFAGHVDFLDPTVPAVKAEIDILGQRVATFLIYLNDDFEDGHTEFPAANLRYRGKTGDAILFYNLRPDGQPDPESRHAGLPPTQGRKWLLSQWIRDKPQLFR